MGRILTKFLPAAVQIHRGKTLTIITSFLPSFMQVIGSRKLRLDKTSTLPKGWPSKTPALRV